ncbi:MAG: hydroxymethylbilane synthase [Alphaproteobacteria bacterium]|nr:hydroxymethylbilane synthase [Alphaproteobacteria bacterium]
MAQSANSLRIGTRGSKLALAQTELVRAALAKVGIESSVAVLKTSGDRIQDRPLADSGGKGLFTRELEEALLAGGIDLAVHSMKDVPADTAKELDFAAMLPREMPNDALVSRAGESLATLPENARLGTSSVRRVAQARRLRPDLDLRLLRGNVDTRLARLAGGDFDAIILAVAGLKRLGRESETTAILDAATWLPALGQGVIGIQVRTRDRVLSDTIARIDHLPTRIALACERAFQKALGGSCRSPIAGLASFSSRRLSFRGEVIAPDGSDSVGTEFSEETGRDSLAEAVRLGGEAGASIKSRAVNWLAG